MFVRMLRCIANRMALCAILFLLGSAFLLMSCGGKTSFESAFIDSSEAGLSSQTMSGILETQEKLLEKPDDTKLPYVLSYQYLQAVRENADTDFYKRIESLLSALENRGINSPEHEFLRGLVAMGKHDFPVAYRIGKKIVDENPQIHRYYGLLVDAQIELGKYDDAVQTLQTMADQNPDDSVLTRIAYVREIHGDVDGAKEAMEQVIRGSTGAENNAWNLAELARLWLPSDPAKAKDLYEASLQAFPGFAPALAGRAKAGMLLGNPAEAMKDVERAIELLPLPEYPALLGDMYATQGQTAKAEAQYAIVKIGYESIAKDGTNVALEQTRFLIEHGMDVDAAVTAVRSVYTERPTIYAADVLAWGLYQQKKYTEAWEYAQNALATGSHDPMILFHAGMIAKANGKNAEAREYLSTVQREAPYFSFVHQQELVEALRAL